MKECKKCGARTDPSNPANDLCSACQATKKIRSVVEKREEMKCMMSGNTLHIPHQDKLHLNYATEKPKTIEDPGTCGNCGEAFTRGKQVYLLDGTHVCESCLGIESSVKTATKAQHLKRTEQIYLAFPYSHEDKKVRQERYSSCLIMAEILMTRTSFPVFAPIVYGHPFAVECKVGTDYDTWKNLNTTMLARWASILIVGTAEGWEESHGVSAEIVTASLHRKPTLLVDPHLSNFPDWSFR